MTCTTRLIAGLGIACLAMMPAAFAQLPVPAASAPPASPAPVDAKFDASLDEVIKTLDNDQQRAALVDSLKKIQAARAQQAQGGGKAGANGLLEAISASVDAIQEQIDDGMDDGRGARAFWQRRWRNAKREWAQLIAEPPQPWGQELLRFTVVFGVWALTAMLLFAPVRWLEKRYALPVPPPPGTSTWRILGFLLVRVLSPLIAFVVTLELARRRAQDLGPSIGRLVALMFAYAYVGGAILTASVMLLLSLFGGGHRRPALKILQRHAAWLLLATGITGALGDALRNAKVEQLIGANLAAICGTAANLLAALLAAVFVLVYRRPIAHLIRDRPYALRRRQPFATQLLGVAAALWHLPMLLLVLVSAGVTLLSPTDSETALRRAIITALLLVLGFLATALTVRRAASTSALQLRAPYVLRFRMLWHVVVVVALWLGWLELVSRVWGHSAYAFFHESPIGKPLARSLGGIGGTVLIAWFLWLVLDTALQEAIAPAHPRRGRVTSTRALTVLPLVRNFTFIAILTIGAIVTLANLGLNVAPLLAGAGVIGLAIGFGAQTLVKDLITGVFILIEDTLAIGDWVTVGDKSGSVESLTIRTVRLRDGDGALHSIPFSAITTIKNQSREFGYAVFNVRLSVDSNVEEAMRLIRETGDALLEDIWLKRDIVNPLELWGLDRFEDGAMVLQGRIKTRPLKQGDIMRAFNRQLKERIDATQNVNFASGVQLLRLDDGRKPVPEDDPAEPRAPTEPGPPVPSA